MTMSVLQKYVLFSDISICFWQYDIFFVFQWNLWWNICFNFGLHDISAQHHSRSKEIWSKKPPITFANNTINQCSSACHIYLFPTQVQSLSDARFSPIVKFSGFSTYPIFQSGRQHPAKSSRKQQIEKNASGVCYFLALTKASELVEVIDLARYSPNTNLGGRKKATRWSFSFGSGKKIYSQLYFPASWGVSHFSIPINEPADLLKWMAHSTFSGNCQSFKRYEMLMGCPWSYLQETTFFH